MQHIHTLLIEDAQPIRLQNCHPYLPLMQVMNLFYQTTRISARPRIFGVVLLSTRTPYNFKTLRLERSLDATVHGVTEKIRQAMLDQADRPNEMVVLYDEPRPNQVIKTALYKRIEEVDPDRKYFARYFRAAETAAWIVGSCGADLVWKSSINEVTSTLPTWHETDNESTSQGAVARLRDIVSHWTFEMPNLNPSAPGFNVNHRFLRLVQALQSCQDYGDDFRGIVFGKESPNFLITPFSLPRTQFNIGRLLMPWQKFCACCMTSSLTSDPLGYQGACPMKNECVILVP